MDTAQRPVELSDTECSTLLTAQSKALATCGPRGINVIPVSTIRVEHGVIQLMNYFMGKTMENISENQSVALTCWSGLEGIQIKGSVRYIDIGDEFNEVQEWIQKHVPNRTLKGVLFLTPTEVHTVTPQT